MGISVFPAGGGEFITNDFVVDMNDTSNNVIDLGRSYSAGAYDVSLASGDTSFDIYAVDADGNSVGYTKDATLVASGPFTQLAILGVAQDERITFAFAGASNDANAEGTLTGAGAYLTSISPSDLPNQDDTANIIGGNFATDVEIYFESGTVSTEAKNVVRSDSTALVVTRPDALDPALDPWDVRAINPGITPPTGSNAHILPGTVDAGALPVWVTTSPLAAGTVNQAYTETLEATDADGAVTYAITAGTLQAGLTLNSTTGVLSGTPTESQSDFTVTATDEGGNSNSREFALPIQVATGGSVTSAAGYIIHTFETSDDFVLEADKDIEYVIVGGGGPGGNAHFFNTSHGGGGGGGGGLLTSAAGDTGAAAPLSLTAGTFPVAVAAADGDSSFGGLTAIAGGHGGNQNSGLRNGGAGGGGSCRTGTSGGTGNQGGDGGNGGGSNANARGGGGGGGGPTGANGGGLGADGHGTNINGTLTHYAGGGQGSVGSTAGDANTLGSKTFGGGQNGSSGVAAFPGIVILRYK